MGTSGWTNDQADSLTLPPGAGTGDPRLVLNADIPPEIATFSFGTDTATTIACILWYGAAGNYQFQCLAHLMPSDTYAVFRGGVAGNGDLGPFEAIQWADVPPFGTIVTADYESLINFHATALVTFTTGAILRIDSTGGAFDCQNDANITGDLTVGGVGQVLFARRTTDSAGRISTTTFVTDTQLQVSATANAVYEMVVDTTFNAVAAAGFKIQIVLPAGATMPTTNFIAPTGALNTNLAWGITNANGLVTGIVGNGSDRPVRLKGTIIMGGTAGTVGVQWAPNASDPTAPGVIVKAGSTLTLNRRE